MRTAAGRSIDRDGAAVRFRERFHEAEAQPEPALRAAGVAAVETTENCFALGGRDTRAVVSDGDDDRVSLGPCGERYVTTGGCVFERVVEEVVDRLAEADGIGVEPRRTQADPA